MCPIFIDDVTTRIHDILLHKLFKNALSKVPSDDYSTYNSTKLFMMILATIQYARSSHPIQENVKCGLCIMLMANKQNESSITSALSSALLSTTSQVQGFLLGLFSRALTRHEHHRYKFLLISFLLGLSCVDTS